MRNQKIHAHVAQLLGRLRRIRNAGDAQSCAGTLLKKVDLAIDP